jgi:hypothetical protein
VALTSPYWTRGLTTPTERFDAPEAENLRNVLDWIEPTESQDVGRQPMGP